MATDMGRGIMAPKNDSNIGTGASEMRTLGATTAAALGSLEVQTNASMATLEAWAQQAIAANGQNITTLQETMLPREEAEHYGIEGKQGDEGPRGPRGLPGMNAVPADEAVAAYIDADDSQTRQALDAVVNTRGKTFVQDVPPEDGDHTNDVWFDTANRDRRHKWVNGQWVPMDAQTNTGHLTVDASYYGAQGDGITDDTTALQDALDAGASAGFRLVIFPTGVYRISSPLRVPANTDVYSHASILVNDDPSMEAFIKIWGSYTTSKRHELAESADAGSRTLTTKTDHNYQPGDILRLVSQRISTDPVDAGDDQLGWETVGGPGPFFSEFVRVQNVTTNTITLDNGLLFNGYRPDDNEESNPDAGQSAYLADTNGKGDNVTVTGFTLRGEAQYGVRVIRTKNTKLRDISWTREETGRFIQFNDTYYADASNCYVETRQWAESHGPEDLSHAAINQYHTAGAWKSGFTNCRSVRGTQAYDFTYAQVTPYPSVWCYVRTSSAEGCLHNPVTAHPGAYGIIIENNLFTDCQRAGISIRSNAAEVTHNVVSGSNHPDLPGVYVFEGGGKQSRVESNTVTNFDVAARLNDGEDKPFRDRIDTIFRGNTFRGFRIGWLRTRTSGLPVPETPQGISLTGNRFETDHPNAVGVITCDLARGINGLVIKDNEFLMRGGSRTVAVKMTANSKNVLIDGSVLHSNTRLLEYDDDRYDADHGPDTVTLGNNEWIEGTQVGTLPACTDTFKLSSTSNDILLVSETNLAHATTAGKFRMSANANVNQANGFPIDNTMCWWEVENNTPAYKTQTVHTIPSNSNNQDIWRRRMTNNVPGSWKKLSATP